MYLAWPKLLPGRSCCCLAEAAVAWQKLLPGFEWISWKSFIIGLISYGYGCFTVIWVPLYNVFAGRANLRG